MNLHSNTIYQEKYFDNGFLSRQISPTMENISYIDRTKVVTQHFLENSFKKLSIKIK